MISNSFHLDSLLSNSIDNLATKVHKDHRSSDLYYNIQNTLPIPGIFTTATIRNGFLIKFLVAKPYRTSKSIHKNGELGEKAKSYVSEGVSL